MRGRDDAAPERSRLSRFAFSRCRLSQDWLALVFLPHRGEDGLRDDLELHVVAPRREVVRAEGGDDEVELGNDDDGLSAVAAGPEGANRPVLVRVVVDPPEIAEMKAAQRGGGGRGALHVVAAENPASVPRDR